MPAPPSSSQPSNSVTLVEDASARKELSNFLFQCFDALKVYGKEPEQMKNLNSMFQMVLADYTFDQVKGAFKFYLKNHSELPAPADIANIIERGNRPPLDKAVYVSISKKHPCDRSSEEWQYLREYEHFELTGEHKSIPKDPRKANVSNILGGGYIERPDGRVESPDGTFITMDEYKLRIRLNRIMVCPAGG